MLGIQVDISLLSPLQESYLDSWYDFNFTRSRDEDINLVPLDEFFVKGPPEIIKPVSLSCLLLKYQGLLNLKDGSFAKDLVKSDEHKLKLARLDWELIERQK